MTSATQTPTTTAPRTWSAKQIAIFDWFERIERDVNEHLVVRARAGTGKTTTIVEALRHAPKGLNILVCAFGKNIQLELESRLIGVEGVTVKTLHATGLGCVKRFWSDVRVNYGTDRENALADRVCGQRAPDAIKKLVAKLCTKGRLCVPHAARAEDLTDIALQFECEPDEDWAFDGFDLHYVCEYAVKAMELAASEKPIRTGIDGADMLFLPVRNQWLRKGFDLVIVDEAQDMNACQLEIAQGSCRGRVVVVGDDRQAIYGFAGADSGSLDRLKTALNATELPLNVTYRCGKAIVSAAQHYVPDFVAGDDNPDGAINSLDISKLTASAAAGDFILSRVNAPLVSIAMNLLRNGKRTRIAGRDIGKGLIALVRKMHARTVPELLKKIAAWETKEVARIEARYAGKTDSSACIARLDGVHDQAEMISSMCDGAPSVAEIETRIEALFTDDGLGAAGMITCSSVHRAKGLEANRVFVIANTIRGGNVEEENIAYVAITRAKFELVWVTENRG